MPNNHFFVNDPIFKCMMKLLLEKKLDLKTLVEVYK